VDLSVVSTALPGANLTEALAYCKRLGIDAIEVGAGGFFPKTLCDPAYLLSDRAALAKFRAEFERSGVRLCAFAIHGQPLHPDTEIASRYRKEFEAACNLANEIGLDKLTLLAGLPEGAPGDMTPNWVFYPFPLDGSEVVSWQWEERLLPYWHRTAEVARSAGVRLCFEMHPNDLVYQPSGLLRLREAIGPVAGANLDPSHLFWQGMDIPAVIHQLGNAIYHVHAKDAAANLAVLNYDGWLDPRLQSNPAARSWNFRTVGYGHDELFWRDYVSTLRLVGYDDAVSIEHEDALIDPLEGLEKAVAILRSVIPRKPAASLWFESGRREPTEA
jgi:sugar phosphate isomerase/epimerase